MSTINYGFPLPLGSDSFKAHRDFKKLADAIDTTLHQEFDKVGVSIEDIQDNKYRSELILLPVRRSLEDRSARFLVSTNGVDFENVSAVPFLQDCADPSIMYRNGYFYIAHSDYPIGSTWDFKISRSQNLSDWEQFNVSAGFRNSGMVTVWAPEWFEDDDGSIYITVSASPTGPNNMRNYIAKVIDLETLTLQPARLLGVELVEDTNKIDPFLFKATTGQYKLLLKDENDKKIEVWKSSDLSTWTKERDSIDALNLFPALVSPSDNYAEGMHVIQINGKTLLYADFYARGHFGLVETDGTLTSFSNATPIRTTEPHRHGTPYVVKDAKAKDIVVNYISSNKATLNNDNFKVFGLKGLTDTTNTITTFKPQHETIYQHNGNEAIVIENFNTLYGAKRFYLTLSASSTGSITLKNSGNIELYEDELVLVAGENAMTLHQFDYVEDSGKYRLINYPSRRSSVGRIDLSTLASGNTISSFNPKDGVVYRASGSEKIAINAISPICKARRFFLLIGSTGDCSISIPNNASRVGTPPTGLTFSGLYGDANTLYEFIYDSVAGVYRLIGQSAYNILTAPKQVKVGTTDPTVGADFLGQFYLNTVTSKVYFAKAATVTNVSDWTALN